MSNNATFAGNTQIVDLYETSGLTPEQISSALGGMNVLAIKAVLTQGSAKFRELGQVKRELAYSDDEAEEAKQVALSLMRYSDDDRLRGKIALRIIDDKRGRLESQNTANNGGGQFANLNINVQVLQAELEKGRQALQTSPAPNGIVEIPAKEAKMLEDARNKK